jgi:hypothetical protein
VWEDEVVVSGAVLEVSIRPLTLLSAIPAEEGAMEVRLREWFVG